MLKNAQTFFQKKLTSIIKIMNVIKLTSTFRTLIISLLVLGGMQVSFAANIALSSPTEILSVGDVVSVDVSLTNNQDSVNAVSGKIRFPSDILQAVSISKAGSILSIWPQEPNFSNTEGYLSFEGAIPNPGFNSSTGKVVTINFKAIKSGKAKVETETDSTVLVNDGNATNVVGTFGYVEFNVNTKISPSIPGIVIKSLSYPDSTKWYASREASFEWDIPEGITSIRTSYDDKENSSPTKAYSPAISNRSFTVDKDGVMYMHVQAKTNDGWGNVSNYKFQIDTEAPKFIKSYFVDGSIISNLTPAVSVNLEDNMSGIDHINMSVDGGNSFSYIFNEKNLYTLPKQVSGKHTLTINAFDKAGNISTTTVDYSILPVPTPVITDYTNKLTTGEHVHVSGNSVPGLKIEVNLTRRGTSAMSDMPPLFIGTPYKKEFTHSEIVSVDESGKFNIISSQGLDAGIYEMKLKAIDVKGVSGDYTDGKIVIVEYTTFVQFVLFVLNWLSFIIIILLVSIAIVAAFWYSFTHFSSFRRKVRSVMAEAENTLKTNVAALRRDIEEYRGALVKAERQRELTKEERDILRKFTKRLDITEKEIEKKIEKIN